MSDKALNNTTLELTQKIQLHFPRDIDSAVLQFWNGQPKETITATLFATFGQIPAECISEPQPILRFGGTVTLPARSTRFTVKDVFVAKKPGARVKFGRVDSDFTDAFGDMVEEPSIGAMLRYDILAKQSAFAAAIEELRASGVITKTTPGELLSLLELQPQGPKSGAGALLADGSANLFEMVAKDGLASHLVSVDWYDAYVGWRVYARPFTVTGQLRAGCQVFSRNLVAGRLSIQFA
jgi:hypothetical protein